MKTFFLGLICLLTSAAYAYESKTLSNGSMPVPPYGTLAKTIHATYIDEDSNNPYSNTHHATYELTTNSLGLPEYKKMSGDDNFRAVIPYNNGIMANTTTAISTGGTTQWGTLVSVGGSRVIGKYGTFPETVTATKPPPPGSSSYIPTNATYQLKTLSNGMPQYERVQGSGDFPTALSYQAGQDGS